MDWPGTAALIICAIGGGLTTSMAGRDGRRARLLASGAALASLAGIWAAFATQMWRFVTVDLRLAEVAARTRDESPWPLRLAGTWAGASGSMLMWATFVITALFLALGYRVDRPDNPDADVFRRRLFGIVTIALALTVGAVARPFALLSEPALRGNGLNPVLEHWAMVIHPPLLYSAQAAVLGAAFLSTDVRRVRRWSTVALALLVASTMLGSWWAHDEMGWGGWWAWDVVENTALAASAAMIAALHARRSWIATVWTRVAAASVLAGIAVTRSGLPSSVHAFSADGWIAVVFAGAAIGVAITAVRHGRSSAGGRSDDCESADSGPAKSSPASHSAAEPDEARGADRGPADRGAAVRMSADPEPADPGPRRFSTDPAGLSQSVTAFAAGWVLVVLGAAACTSVWLGTRNPPASITGERIGWFAAPAGLVVFVGIICFGIRRCIRPPVLLAHLGVIVFGVGVIASMLGSSSATSIPIGEASRVGDHSVRIKEIMIDDSRTYETRVTVLAELDGRTVQPSVVRHEDLGRTRARPARTVGFLSETELTVAAVLDGRVFVEVRSSPGLPLIWVGSAALVVSLLWATVDGSLRADGQDGGSSGRRRSRFAASNESSVEPPPGDLDAPAGASAEG
ncbi:MAG: cytochrome c biogenesis protein CcsA [Microthrixaceae bacterium]